MKKYIRLKFSCQVGVQFDNDIAIIRTSPEEESKFASKCSRGKIWPACFPSYDLSYNFWTDTWVSGWGRTQETNPGSISITLQDAQLVAVDWETCRFVMGDNLITPRMICAGAQG